MGLSLGKVLHQQMNDETCAKHICAVSFDNVSMDSSCIESVDGKVMLP